MNETIEYYNRNAETYYEDTVHADMKYAYDRILFFLPKEGRILDFGCGSGRDAAYFASKGYIVDAVDASAEMVRLAQEKTGVHASVMRFDQLDAVNAYEGIWACASLLHCTMDELRDLLPRMARAVRLEGIFYASFKYGDFEGMRNGRWFTDLDVNRAASLILPLEGCTLLDCWISHDVRRQRREERWLNVIVRRVAPLKDDTK